MVHPVGLFSSAYCGAIAVQTAFRFSEQVRFYRTEPERVYGPPPKLFHLISLPRPGAGVFQGLGLIFIASMAAAAAGFGHTVALFAAFVSFFGYFPWIVRLGYVRRKANQIPMVLLILMVSPSQALPAIEGLISVVYFSAGIAKLAESGPRWANGETFQSHLIATYLLRDRKSALWLSRSRTACAVISTVVLVWELTFPVVLILPQYKWIWVVTGVLFHLSTVPARIHYWIYFGPLYFVFLAPWGADWLNRHPW